MKILFVFFFYSIIAKNSLKLFTQLIFFFKQFPHVWVAKGSKRKENETENENQRLHHLLEGVLMGNNDKIINGERDFRAEIIFCDEKVQ